MTEQAQPTAAEPTAAELPSHHLLQPRQLDYYIVGAGDTDQRPRVEEAINAYIEPLIGANVTFHIIPWNDWATKAVTGIEAGEKMDIFFTADWYYYMQLATEGLFTPLNDDSGPNGNLLERMARHPEHQPCLMAGAGRRRELRGSHQ
jgi:putative aldouronate transport system substrate-binding protein